MANRPVEIKYTKLFINNEFVEAVSKKTFPTINPATENKLADVAEADLADVDIAVKAAKAAFACGSEWRNMSATKRGYLLNKLADLMDRDTDHLAELETLDSGKPLSDSVFDVQCSVDTLRYYAGWCDKVHGKTIPSDGPLMTMTIEEPVGVVGQIIPWNYPVLMLVWKWGPAIATGCTMILKPAEQTPLSALYMAALAKEAGFPKGVINVVPGYGPTAGEALAKHMDVNKIAFTGSVKIGRLIMEQASKSNLKRVSLELGGKSPLVVMNDFDVDEAVNIAYAAIFTTAGQNCCAGSRTFVHSKMYDEFVKKAIEKAKKRKVGDPLVKDTEQGPQVDNKMFERVLKYIESGTKEGARLETGGKRLGNKGYFIEPTVFSNVQDNMSIAREEIFGPVQSIFKFDTLEEVIKRCNDSEFGLAAAILTHNLENAMTFAQSVRAGSVWINCYDMVVPQAPFGGYKMSGFGRELGADSLKEYLEVKCVTMKNPMKM